MTPKKSVVILVGHGGLPSDCPGALVSRLKMLEARRSGTGRPPSDEEAALDLQVRSWPRTKKSDPYQAGLEALGRALKKELKDTRVVLAYNEFCAPSLETAVANAVGEGAREITIITTMFTRGGIHSEAEIPEIVKALRRKNPKTRIRYAWPFSLPAAAAFLAAQARR